MKKLIRVFNHFHIVDTSDIKHDDTCWFITEHNTLFHKNENDTIRSHPNDTIKPRKITHSTDTSLGVFHVNRSQILNLIGEIDLNKEALKIYPYTDGGDLEDCIDSAKRRIWINGYEKSLKDNKDKIFTLEDVKNIINKSRELESFSDFGVEFKFKNELNIIEHYLPKNEWNVNVNGNIISLC